MSKTKKPFLRMDLDMMRDPQIRKMVNKLGHSSVTLYLWLCACMADYKCYNYAIPKEDLSFISGELSCTKEELERVINYCLFNDEKSPFLYEETDCEGNTYYYSSRRRRELLDMEEESRKRSISGKKGMENRWKNKENTYENNN